MAVLIQKQSKTVIRGKEGTYTLIKGSIHQDITIIKIYTTDTRNTKYIKQTDRIK